MRPLPAPPPRLLTTTLIYLGFAATGVGLALPGSVLPALLAQWSLADGQAGLLFFLSWSGCSIGAMLVRGSLVWSLARGCLLLAIAGFGMAYGTRWTSFAWMALFGLGLGITMTTTSLLQSARNPGRRGLEFNRLNLVWAAGACLCPTLAAHSLRIANIRGIFTGFAIFFLLLFLWMALVESRNQPPKLPSNRASQWTLNFSLWPLTLVILVFLPTGIEAAIGGWAATYMQRTQAGIGTTVTAGTCFWFGILLSRAVSSTILALRTSPAAERTVLRLSLAAVAAGTLLLVASHIPLAILPAVFLIGFGLGPVYPLLLARALPYSENPLIFFVAGLGSAFLPWLTGVVSGATFSLRNGLFVPTAAALLMLTLGLRLTAQDNTANTAPHPPAAA